MFQVLYLLFVSVNLIKENLCEKFTGEGLKQRAKGEGTFAKLLHELVSSGIRVN
jgi:hypothetical protein